MLDVRDLLEFIGEDIETCRPVYQLRIPKEARTLRKLEVAGYVERKIRTTEGREVKAWITAN
ncbi:hypothetical protein EBM76_14050 [Vibrio parahaemolyticus]|nr:hypothetical protein [Vibrio parahaemolyticus]